MMVLSGEIGEVYIDPNTQNWKCLLSFKNKAGSMGRNCCRQQGVGHTSKRKAYEHAAQILIDALIEGQYT